MYDIGLLECVIGLLDVYFWCLVYISLAYCGCVCVVMLCVGLDMKVAKPGYEQFVVYIDA